MEMAHLELVGQNADNPKDRDCFYRTPVTSKNRELHHKTQNLS